MSVVNKETCRYCFLDLDVNGHRDKLATGAAFVHATDSRYGLSSKDLRLLGGSELVRIHDLIEMDHEWSSKNVECGGIEIRPPRAGNRIVVELYWDVAPLACENFATLCRNTLTSKVGESGKPLSYQESKIHRVLSDFIMQGGDFVFGNGSGGESIYNGKKFKDERAALQLKHDTRGVLSMGNSGKNSNTSQFFITFQAAPQCDGKHVVFGKVVSGFEVLDYIETFGTTSGEPSVPITITDCGIYTPFETAGAGYWYDQPDDDAYSGISPTFITRPRIAVVAPTLVIMERFEKSVASHASMTGVCVQELETEERVVERITNLLQNFAVDVVVIAPTCSHLQALMKLPESWKNIPIEKVVLQAKPVTTLTTVWTESWMATSSSSNLFTVDGAPI